MQIDQAGIDMIKSFENCELTVYKDVAGNPTIGVGHLIKPPESPEDFAGGITEAEADQMLLADLAPVQNAVNRLADPSCNQNQFNALCDFAFNLGVGALETMMAHGWDQIPAQIPRWNHAGGIVVDGLTKRRAAEVALFQS
jgi:GH24 family phage-related lysozyme (muramidase)